MYESHDHTERLAQQDPFEFELEADPDTLFDWSLRDFADILPTEGRAC